MDAGETSPLPTVADNAVDANPHAEPPDGDSGEVDSRGRDGSSVAPAHESDQPRSSDELFESTDAADGGESHYISPDIESVAPNSRRPEGPEETSFDPLEDTRRKAESPSTQPAEDQKHVQCGSVNTDTDSKEESTNAQQSEDFEPTPPRRIGGRRGHDLTSVERSPKDDAKGKRRFMPRPHLICRQERGSWRWEVVLSVDDECNIAEVQHDGSEPLPIVNGECCLSSFIGSLSTVLADGQRLEFALFDGRPMVFKSRNNWDGDSRKVEGITNGYFIVIAPREWKRTGCPPVEPAECTDTNFTAHYFFRGRGESAGDVDGFEEYETVLTRSGLDFIGDRVFDDSEDGELFVGPVPKLNPLSGTAWARVGEEKKGGWQGENFKPAEQFLADVLNVRQGQFFVRVYDDDTKLLDSDEFRYLRDLREIRVNGEPYSANTLLVPPSTGHSRTELISSVPMVPLFLRSSRSMEPMRWCSQEASSSSSRIRRVTMSPVR